MVVCIKDLETVLRLPNNCHITEASLTALSETSQLGFSSLLKQLKVQWKAGSVSTDEIRMETEHSGKVMKAQIKPPEKRLPDDLKSAQEKDASTKSDEDSMTNMVIQSTEDSAVMEHIDNQLQDELTYEDGEMNLIAKCMPKPSVWVALNSEATFEKELSMYSRMVPVYLHILERLIPAENATRYNGTSRDLPLFPKFYGGRLNLENRPDFVDENAVILLENLSLRGYENYRKPKLNDSHFRQVLHMLALFHSVGIIIQHDPKYNDAFEYLLTTSKPFFFGAKDKNIDRINAERRHKLMRIVEAFGYEKDVEERLLDVLVKTDEKTLPNQKTCYYSLIHNDMWINNIMFKYCNPDNDEETIIDLKLIDFQNTDFGSVAKEIAFLLYTSVDHSLWNDLERYISLFHDCLVNHLKTYFHECSSKEFISEFSVGRFKSELKSYTCHKLKHIFIIMKILYGKDDWLYEINLKQILDHCVQNGFI